MQADRVPSSKAQGYSRAFWLKALLAFVALSSSGSAYAVSYSSSGSGWFVDVRGAYALSYYYKDVDLFMGPALDVAAKYRTGSTEFFISVGQVTFDPLIEDQNAGTIRHQVSWRSIGAGVNLQMTDSWWGGISLHNLENSTKARLTYPDGAIVDQESTVPRSENAVGIDLRYKLLNYQPVEIDAGVQYMKMLDRNAHTIFPYVSIVIGI